MKIEFQLHTGAAYSKAVPHLLALTDIEEEEDKAKWIALEVTAVTEKKPDPTSAAAAPPATLASLLPTASTGPTATTAASPSDLLAGLAAGEAPPFAPSTPASSAPNANAADAGGKEPASADPLALLAAAAAAASTPSTPSPASPTAAPSGSPTTKSSSDDALASLLPAGQVQTDFVVYDADGSKKGSYAGEKDAVQVYQHMVGQVSTSEELDKLGEANAELYNRLDRGGKTSMTRAFAKRKEDLAALMAALNGEGTQAPPATEGQDRGPLTHDEFFAKFVPLASKTGPTVVTQIYIELGAKSHNDLDASLYWKALDMMQQVIDNKGK